MNIIFGNYGNPTIAAIQWTYEQQLANVYVVTVKTGWEGEGWNKRVEQAELFVKNCKFNVIRLNSKPSFQGLMEDRGDFPSTKFQWCAGFLKGLPFLDWLDQHDAKAEATIILGKRRLASKLNFDLPEFIEESEHYGDRKVWYPLYKHTDAEYQTLLVNAGLEILQTRSLECDPCVNSFGKDLARLAEPDILKTKQLEEKLKKHIFSLPIEAMVKQARQTKEDSDRMFDMGCGAPFACGE